MVRSQMLHPKEVASKASDQEGTSNDDNYPASHPEEAMGPMDVPQCKRQKMVTLVAIYLSVFISALDTVILPTAMPTITVALNASDTGFAWIGATHMLSGATSLVLWSKISDIFGRKSMFLTANVAFLAGSLISALCNGIGMLFIGRVFQGMGGAGTIILGNRVIDDISTDRDRVRYLALSGVAWSVAMAVAPLLGGAFAQRGHWRWCFWINLPCIAISFVLVLVSLNFHHHRASLRVGLSVIDWLGALTLLMGTVLFLLGIEMGGVQFPWASAPTICFIFIGLSTIVLFILVEWKFAPQPLFPLRIFRNRSAAACFVLCVAQGMAFISHLYFMPCYFQAVLHASPLQSGLWSFIMTGLMAIVNVLVKMYLGKQGGHKLLIRTGAALLTLGLGLFIDLPPYRSWIRIVLYQIVVAFGLGMLFQPPLIALQNNLPTDDVGIGTSAFLFVRPVGYGVSAVVGQLLLQTQMKARYQAMLRVSIPTKIAELLAFEDTVKGTPMIRHLDREQQEVVRGALSDGLNKTWIFYTAVASIALLAAFCVQEERQDERDEKECAGNLAI